MSNHLATRAYLLISHLFLAHSCLEIIRVNYQESETDVAIKENVTLEAFR